MPSNPLPADGVIGRLTPEQQTQLREFWVELYKLVDEAPEHGKADLPTGSNQSGADDAKNDGKDAGKDIPKVSPHSSQVPGTNESWSHSPV